LVVFAMSLLLLAAMVCMTLSFGTKAKERMELQQVADQGAYSTAVAVARSFNLLSTTNRVMLATEVAMLGINASSSFASLWAGVVEAIVLYYGLDLVLNQFPKFVCAPIPQCGCWGVFFEGLRLFRAWGELMRVQGVLATLDWPVAVQANRASLQSMWLYGGQVDTTIETFAKAVDNQKMTKNVMNASATGPEWTVPSAADNVAAREVGKIPYVDGALNVNMLMASDRHAVMAAMGSRGHPWTAGRGNFLSQAPSILNAQARAVFGADISFVFNDGNSYFGAPFHTNNMFVTTSTAAVADDHAQAMARYTGPGCPAVTLPVMAAAFVWSNAVPGYWVHAAGTGIGLPVPFDDVIVILPAYGDNFHDISGLCALNCPSAWTNFADYNLFKVAFGGDNFAQPKLPVTVQRDMRSRLGSPDPWNLLFNFRFQQSGAGKTFDTNDRNGIVLGDGTDISKQTALATGVAYYHRQGHWREPPNLFNPFWRGGLTHSDIDDQARGAGGDIRTTLVKSGVSWAADAYDDLYNAGFRGLQ
jgi:hypothetical protein